MSNLFNKKWEKKIAEREYGWSRHKFFKINKYIYIYIRCYWKCTNQSNKWMIQEREEICQSSL